MNKGQLMMFLLLLTGGVALAAVYRWVDESGRVHYGDAPPEESNAQSVAFPEGPSQEEVERARREMQQKIEQHRKFSEDAGPPEPLQKPSTVAQSRFIGADDLACFSPLSDLAEGPSADSHTPVTPTLLTGAQQKMLENLFNRADARWRGVITDSTCTGSSSQPGSRITHYAAQTAVDRDARTSRLTMETDAVGQDSHAVERLFWRFEMGNALYFSDAQMADNLALEGNRVEVRDLSQDRVSFIIKRHIPGSPGTRRPRAEVRQLEVSGRTLKLMELYYNNGVLTGSRNWILDR